MPSVAQLASKPQLVKIDLDTQPILDQYGEAVTIWVWDRQPLETFIRLATTSNTDFGEMVMVLKDMILDEEGQPVMSEGRVLPDAVLVAAMDAITQRLGK